jgi:ribosomal protein L24
MMKTGVAALFIALVITGACSADEIRGKVGSVDEAKKTLRISGVAVQASDAWIENEQDYPLALGSIASGDYVEVGGKFTGPSEIKAKKIDRKIPECGLVRGKIASVDAKKREVVISGIMVKVLADAWLEGPDHVKIPIELFAPGYKVECRGDWTAESELTAFKVTVE